MSTFNVVVSNDESIINLQVEEDSAATIIEVGEQGPEGIQGPSGTMAVGTVTTVSPSTPASIVNVGTPENSVLNFNIPKGDTGDPFSNVDGGRADSVYGGIEPIDGGTP